MTMNNNCSQGSLNDKEITAGFSHFLLSFTVIEQSQTALSFNII